VKIFLSWSGARSRAMAEALRGWLPLVLHYVEPWSSGRDIPAGERWSAEISSELEKTNFGIICLTKDNLSAPWIMFEAGAISKAVSIASVCPYLLGADNTDITSTEPLAQFQAKKAEKGSTLELVQSINKKSATAVEEPQLEKLFEVLWPQLEQKLADIPGGTAQPDRPARSQPEILEELVETIRTVDRRLDQLENTMGLMQRAALAEGPAMLRQMSRRKTSRKPISIRIALRGTQYEEGSEFSFVPSLSGSFAEEVAELLGLDPDTASIGWELRDPKTNKELTFYDAGQIYSHFGDSPPVLLLQEGIPF
jgi:hypothetical protein